MRGAEAAPQGEFTEGAQHQYCFTRQPVKYQRQTSAARLRNHPGPGGGWKGHDGGPPPTEDPHPAAADSGSRSSSPEVETQRQVQVEISAGSTITSASHAEPQRSPPGASVDCRGEACTTSTAVTAASSNHKESAGSREVGLRTQAAPLANPNAIQSNNEQSGVDQGGAVRHAQRRHPGEQILTGPAQKILAGLKQRRSNSAVDEQLFV